MVIGRIQGRCECTYIRTHQANNTLTENQNEQIATCEKKDKRKKKMNVRKMEKKWPAFFVCGIVLKIV